jgi:AraC-like DNA-binding protein
MLGMSLNTIAALAISQLSFMCLFFLTYHRQQLIGRLLVFYSFCLACYAATIFVDGSVYPVVDYILMRVAIMGPAALWLLAVYLFVDNARVPKPVIGLMLLYMTLRAFGTFIGAGDFPPFDGLYLLTYVLPQIIMMGFCGHAVYLAIQDLDTDLVESRRRVRVPFVVAMGMLVTAILVRGFVMAYQHYADQHSFTITPMSLELLFFYMFLITLVFNITSMRLQNDAFQVMRLSSEQQNAPLSPVPGVNHHINNPAVVQSIYALLQQEKLHTKPGLTIGELAERLSIQEYRLRRLINKQLGYRNFNQFLNEFRIQEACKRLAVAADRREQIAIIAFDVGYSALSSFNKAFKDIMKVTPTQYRDAALQEHHEEYRKIAN